AEELMRITDRAYMGAFVEELAAECSARDMEFRNADGFKEGQGKAIARRRAAKAVYFSSSSTLRVEP
ncbi:MAG: hypothetical protein ACE5IJ_09095, partial [Thermoplasmata archaeon]